MLSDAELIATANEQVSIEDAAAFAGFTLNPGMKNSCPFCGDRQLRVYGPHRAYCHNERISITPTRCVIYREGSPGMTVTRAAEADAARRLLEHVGWMEPSLENRWAATEAYAAPVDTDALVEALKIFCSRFPDWEDRQLDPSVSSRFTAFLALLPRVRGAADGKKWLTAAKAGMRVVLESEDLT